jgi:hypothetical protein
MVQIATRESIAARSPDPMPHQEAIRRLTCSILGFLEEVSGRRRGSVLGLNSIPHA